jgi:hypothetical protein
MSLVSISFSAAIAISKNAEIAAERAAEREGEEGIALRARCTRETGNARHAEPLSPSFLLSRMNRGSINFFAAIAISKNAECK